MAKKPQLSILGGPKTVTRLWPAYPEIDHNEVHAATEVLTSRNLSDVGRGQFTARMEDSYSSYFGTKYCLSCCSGTAAIHAALFAVGAHPGSEVITCAHNWISAINAIFHAGCVPIFCDTAPNAWSIDPKEIERKVTPNTKAVIVTHLWGIPADMDPIMRVCKKLGLPVIEDTSHSHGSKYKGRYCGTIGDMGAFSLQGSKAIVAGEGGFLLTDDDLLYQRATVPGHHVMRLGDLTRDEVKPFVHAGGMYTYRIATIAAAIATEQLKKLPTLNAARQANFDRLFDRIKEYDFLTWPKLAPKSVRGWYSTPVLFDAKKAGISRDTFVKACEKQGIRIAGEGYCDYSQIPLFQNMDALDQLFVRKHTNGVEFKPYAKGSFPNYVKVKDSMVIIGIPHIELPDLIDEIADAFDLVANNLPALKKWEKENSK